MIEWKFIQRSTVVKIGYDAEVRSLIVVFSSGGEYEYKGVPKDIADGLLRAESKGGYLFANIRDKFPCVCLKRAPAKEPAIRRSELEQAVRQTRRKSAALKKL